MLAGGGELAAQDAWPAYSSGCQIERHRARAGLLFRHLEAGVLLVLVVWIWVKSADWVGRDTEEMGEAIGMPAESGIRSWCFVPLLGFLLAMTIPIFFAGWAARCCCSMLAPFVTYVVQRNGKVTERQEGLHARAPASTGSPTSARSSRKSA